VCIVVANKVTSFGKIQTLAVNTSVTAVVTVHDCQSSDSVAQSGRIRYDPDTPTDWVLRVDLGRPRRMCSCTFCMRHTLRLVTSDHSAKVYQAPSVHFQWLPEVEKALIDHHIGTNAQGQSVVSLDTVSEKLLANENVEGMY